MNKICLLILLVGCSKEYSFATVEDARAQAKENGVLNAQQYRAENKLAEHTIYARGDSTIAPECPNGDGWASMDLKGPSTIKLKCSTVSGALGCMTDEDFKTKPFASEEGKCAPLTKVPHPLPKIGR
jgi:hypothetical protein